MAPDGNDRCCQHETVTDGVLLTAQCSQYACRERGLLIALALKYRSPFMKFMAFAVLASAALMASGTASAQQEKEKQSGATSASQKSDKVGSNTDANRLKDLAQANMAEIEAGKLAAQKAQGAEVKKFAQRMVDDHSKQLEVIKKLAQAKAIELPTAPDAKHEGAMKKLQ